MKQQNKKGYSVIVIILILGFLIVLTTGVFRLVLNEHKDNRAIGHYTKSFSAAESAQELALLDIKEDGYGTTKSMNNSGVIKKTGTSDNTKITLGYQNDGKVTEYEGEIEPLSYNFIPLFYIDSLGNEQNISDYNLTVSSPNKNSLSWNIVSASGGISGDGSDFSNGKEKKYDQTLKTFSFSSTTKTDFLTRSSSDKNYLILFNNSNSNISYTIKGTGTQQYFTKPILTITSQGSSAEFRQNIETTINYRDLVNRSKYAIYSQ